MCDARHVNVALSRVIMNGVACCETRRPFQRGMERKQLGAFRTETK